jgi:hypothetical protein
MQNSRIAGFEYAMNEHFDLNDRETRKILLAVNETDQNQILTALTSKLYDNIVNKVDDIDFGSIPNTKGDVTKLQNYNQIIDCINTIKDLLIQYKQNTNSIDTIRTALNNIQDRTSIWMKAYAIDIELPIIIYNTIVLSIVSSISFLIATCIEFIKSPSQEGFDIMIDRVAIIKTKDNLLFGNLEKFNKSCAKGELDNCMNYIIKNNSKQLLGIDPFTIVGGMAIAGLLINIIPIMRELIFFFYHSRQRVSDYFDIQADLLHMNAENLRYNSVRPKDEKDRIVKKQLGIVDKFRKISNFMQIKQKEAESKATKDLVETSKQYKTNELLDTVPDSATSVLF